MKIRTPVLLALLCAAQAAAAAPVLARPAETPSEATIAPHADTATVEYEVGGLRVIHRPLAANALVAVNLYLLGGSRQLDAETAGVEALLLATSEFGTRHYPSREARLALARTGSRTVLEPGADWTLFGFRGLATDFDSTWAVFADRLMHPTLEAADVEVVRRRMLRAYRARENHPDTRLRLLADSAAFGSHPYRYAPEGTAASLAGLSVDALRAYRDAEIVTSRMLLVVVGPVPRAQVEAAVQRTLARLPRGGYAWSLPPPWPARRAGLTVHAQALPTNYILGYFAGPPADSRDYVAFRVATGLLGGFAAYDIRANGLSYAAYAPFLERGAAGGGVYVSTTRPDTTMRVFNATIDLLRDGSPPRSLLRRYFDGFVTGYYRANESSAGQADFLARYQLLHGDWRLSARYLEDLQRVQGYHIRNAARQYFRNIQYVYIGNPALVPERELTRF